LGNDADVDGKQLQLLSVAGKPVHGKLEPLPKDNKKQLAFIYVPTTGYRPNLDAYVGVVAPRACSRTRAVIIFG